MLCLKKRRTYSFTQGACSDIPRRSKKEKNVYNEALNIAVTTLPRKHRSREERSSGAMVLTVTEDTPADMLAGSMELLVQLPRDHNVHTQRVTVPRSTPMMDLLVQIATAHKLSASSYTLQAIGERGLVLPHQPNTPIGALDALQVKLLPKQGTFLPRKAKQANQPFETTFRLQVLLPRNQLYVSRVSPKMNLGKILEEVCQEKNLDKNKYELRHPANLEETLDLSLSLQDYHLQEVTLYAKQGRSLGAALSSQDIMALQRQEERRRQQAKQSVFGFMFRKSKESSLSIDSLGGRSVSPARSDETGRSVSPLAPPSRPQRKRRPAPKPPVQISINDDESKEKLVISHSRNSSDSSGYHEASVLSDNPDSHARMPETLPRRSKPPCKLETSRKLAQTSQASKSLGNLAMASGGLSHGISSTSISSTGIRKKRAAPPPPIARPLSSAISTQALERIVDSEESLTSDIDISKSPSDIAASSKANSDIGVNSKANSDIGVHSMGSKPSSEIGFKIDAEFRAALADHDDKCIDIETLSAPLPPPARFKPSLEIQASVIEPESRILSSSNEPENVEIVRVVKRETGTLAPTPKPRSAVVPCESSLPVAPKRRILGSTNNDATPVETFEKNNDEVDPKIDEMIKIEEKDSVVLTDVELREKKAPRRSHNSGQETIANTSTMMQFDTCNIVKNRQLKHVKSMDDIYGTSMEFADEEIGENEDSSSGRLSCAVISTIPKCAHLTTNIEDTVEVERVQNSSKHVKSNLAKVTTKEESELLEKNLQAPQRPKIFRSQSALNDFDVNPFEKHTRHLTSHPEDFTCALNPNFSRSIVNLEGKEMNNETTEMETHQSDGKLEIKPKNIVNDLPPFVVQSTNQRCEEKIAGTEDNWEPQLIGESVSGDRTTETDILLQKVSDTLSNSLPISKPTEEVIVPVPDEKFTEFFSESDEFDGIRETTNIPRKTHDRQSSKEVETKNRESLLLMKSNLVTASSPNATMNSQQDTSDYVSATGDDLSITDWEYQLPAPPSAFRDNISPDFDGYDTITLRSVEAFTESVAQVEKNPQSLRESPIPPPIVSDKIELFPKSVEIPKMEIHRVEQRSSQAEKPKLNSQTSCESRKSEASLELKKEIITELATKIENGSLPQTNGKIFEQDSRRTTAEFAAPKIAPADNTLSNFTITTYSRQKSLNIFEEEPVEERQGVSELKNSEERSRTLSTLSTGKSSQNSRDNFGSRNTSDRVEEDISGQMRLFLKRAQSVEHIVEPEVELKKSEAKSHFVKNDSLLRSPSLSNGYEKSAIVHRSKSYITLANNSKYREDVNFENSRNENDDSRMIKSTSVTNLNHEASRNNDKFSQWRENILKRQEEPSKEKQLQSLQVLKSILPRLKDTQQTEEDVTDSSNVKEQSNDTRSKTVPEADTIESKSNIPETRAEAEIRRNETEKKSSKITTEETTTKRYKYTGPPAISLGSWSERPRVNVQLKMDTDYKFGPNNNVSGPKTVVNLNGTSGEKNDDKQNTMKLLPKNITKNGMSTSNGTHQETLQERRDSEEDLAKKMITHTTAIGFKKSTFNKISQPEIKRNDDKPMVTSVALKKTYTERSDSRVSDQQREGEDDDVKIDTKPVNFKELTKTFGQEVCLRARPQRIPQNRHSDYYGTRSDIAKTFTNGQTNFWDKNPSRNVESCKNPAVSNESPRDTNNPPNRRYTSVVGIQSQNNDPQAMQNGESTMKNHATNTRINGFMPVVKGFKMQVSQNETKSTNVPTTQNSTSIVNSFKNTSNVPPPPPTMPIITGVTLKNSTTRPKSVPICNVDPRDQLLESIRSFGGRDSLKSVNILS